MENHKKPSLLDKLYVAEEVIGTSHIRMAFKELESRDGYKEPYLMTRYREEGGIDNDDITPERLREFTEYGAELADNLGFYRKVMRVREAFTLAGVGAVGGALGLLVGSLVKRIKG